MDCMFWSLRSALVIRNTENGLFQCSSKTDLPRCLSLYNQTTGCVLYRGVFTGISLGNELFTC